MGSRHIVLSPSSCRGSHSHFSSGTHWDGGGYVVTRQCGAGGANMRGHGKKTGVVVYGTMHKSAQGFCQLSHGLHDCHINFTVPISASFLLPNLCNPTARFPPSTFCSSVATRLYLGNKFNYYYYTNVQWKWYISTSESVLSHQDIYPPRGTHFCSMSQNSLMIGTGTLFTDPVWLQCHSDDIVVFCSILHQCVKIAWWVEFFCSLSISLTHIIKANIKWCSNWAKWASSMATQAWPLLVLFCPLKTGEPISCQIVHGVNGCVFAYCGQYPSHCGFQSKFTVFKSHTLLFNSSY